MAVVCILIVILALLVAFIGWGTQRVLLAAIEQMHNRIVHQEILINAIFGGLANHQRVTNRQHESLLTNLIYVKTFCEEYSWLLVHFNDKELMELAEGERIRQERIEHQGNDPSIQWSFGDSRPIGMGGSFAASLVRESVGGEVVRYDSRDQVTDRRANGSASAGGEV